jgi:hypothetical protein
MKHRTWSIAGIGGLAVLLGGYTAYWLIAAGTVGERVDAWADEHRAAGYEIAFAERDVGGFPFRFEVLITKPNVTNVPKGWHWEAESLTLSARPWNLHHIGVSFPGRHDISLYTGDAWFDFTCLIKEAAGELSVFGDGQVREFHSEIRDVAYSRPGVDFFGSLDALSIDGRRFDDADPDYRTPSAEMRLSVSQALVPEDASWVLHKHPIDFALTAQVTGPLPNGDAPVASLTRWRDAGGVIEVDRMGLFWGPIEVETTGTLTLDEAMRPLGAFTADIIGHGDIIDLLAANDFVSLGEATLYKLGFALLARPRVEGGPPVLSVPITMQDGELKLGPVTIDQIPPVVPSPVPANEAGS